MHALKSFDSRKSVERELSLGEQGVWYLHQAAAAKDALTVRVKFEIRGHLDLDRLLAAIRFLIQRHDTLRTNYLCRDGELIAIAHDRPDFAFTAHRCAGKGVEHIQGVEDAQAAMAFDLATDSLVRVLLFSQSASEHFLTFITPHLIIDGFSFGSLLRDLLWAYSPRTFPVRQFPAICGYSEYVASQKQFIEEKGAEHLRFWSEKFRQDWPRIALPYDRPRPRLKSLGGNEVSLQLLEAETQAWRLLAQRRKVTVYAVGLAAFHVWLARLSHQDRFVTGTLMSGRSQPAFQNSIGFFVNPVPMCVDVPSSISFDEMIQRTWKSVLSTMEHQEYPFQLLAREFRSGADSRRSPIFDVLTNWFPYDPTLSRSTPPHSDTTDPDFQLLYDPQGAGQYDLVLMGYEMRNRIHVAFRYDSDLFDSSTVRHMLEGFVACARFAVSNPQLRISDIPDLGASEKYEVITRKTSGRSSSAKPKKLVEMFSEQVRRTPNAPAVKDARETLTFGQLDHYTDRLTNILVGNGIGPEMPVGVRLQRSNGLVTAILATLKAGGVYVPIDPDLPQDRSDQLIAAARVGVILSDTDPSFFAMQQVRVVRLPDSMHDLPKNVPCTNAVNDSNLAYIIFTSGSTGSPKPVGIPHAAIANHMRWMARELRLESTDRFLQRTPISFDASVWELLTPLLGGSCLVMAEPRLHADPNYLVRTIVEEQITILQLVPSILRLLLDHPRFGSLRSLRCILCGGEQLTADLTKKAAEFLPQLKIYNLYGPTEATIDTLAHECSQIGPGRNVPIGTPIDNVEAYVLSPDLKPLPVGTSGELYLGGQCLARGYLDQPGVTATRFIPNPFSLSGTRLYRTGDQCRLLKHGSFEFLGRKDEQVKNSGVRIELGEIEALLVQHPDVAQAAIVVVGEDDTRRLVAFVRPSRTEPDKLSNNSADRLVLYLRDRLPRSMVPSSIIHVKELPHTLSGKLDKAKLLTVASLKKAPEEVPPSSATERALLEIWTSVLKRPITNVDEDFYALGGTSIAALVVRAHVEETLGKSVDVSSFLTSCTTIRQLALLLDGPSRPGSPLIPLRDGDGPIIVCIHPIGGTVACYQKLVRLLPPGFRVFGLDSILLAPDIKSQLNQPDLVAMASSYADVLLTLGCALPVHLIGWSMGGLIGFELAKILERRSIQVASLSIIDVLAPVPNHERPGLVPDEQLLLSLYLLWGGFAATSLPSLYAELCNRSPSERRLWIRDRLQRSTTNPQAGSVCEALVAGIDTILEATLIHMKAAWMYRSSEPYKGNTLLLRAADRTDELKLMSHPWLLNHIEEGLRNWMQAASTMTDLGWKRLIPNLFVETVPGTHFDLLSSSAEEVVARLNRALDIQRRCS